MPGVRLPSPRAGGRASRKTSPARVIAVNRQTGATSVASSTLRAGATRYRTCGLPSAPGSRSVGASLPRAGHGRTLACQACGPGRVRAWRLTPASPPKFCPRRKASRLANGSTSPLGGTAGPSRRNSSGLNGSSSGSRVAVVLASLAGPSANRQASQAAARQRPGRDPGVNVRTSPSNGPFAQLDRRWKQPPFDVSVERRTPEAGSPQDFGQSH